MRRIRATCGLRAAILLLLASCGGGASSRDPRLLAEFDPPEPLPGQRQFLTPILHVGKGADVLLCSYLPIEVEEESDIVSFRGVTSSGNHHAFLYGVLIEQE